MLWMKQVKAKGCRGIVDGPTLNLKPGGLLLCGDNGTGKSSFVDAIEKVLAGTCGSIDTGRQTTSWARHGKNIIADEGPAVELIMSDGCKESSLDLATDRDSLPRRYKDLMEAAEQGGFILRRRALLRFIESRPRDRYEALEMFLNLQQFVAMEDALKELRDRENKRLLSVRTSRAQGERDLRDAIGLDEALALDGARCLEKVNAIFTEVGMATIAEMGGSSDRVKAIDLRLSKAGDMEALHALQNLRALLDRVRDLGEVRRTAESYKKAAELHAEEHRTLKGHFYEEVLKKGLQWIQEDELPRCPLCDNKICPSAVEEHVQEQLAGHETLIALKRDRARRQTQFSEELRDTARELDEVRAQWTDAMGDHMPQEELKRITQLRELATTHAEEQSVATISDAVSVLASKATQELRHRLRRAVDARLGQFEDPDRTMALFEARHQLARIVALTGKLEEAKREEQSRAESLECLRTLVSLAQEARKTAVQELVDQVAEIADRYYSKIHPADNIGRPELKVPDRGQGSIDLTSEFHKTREDPRGYLSEGHLDSLGLCLFLAIRRLHHTQRPELAILVLDDVLHSVDGAHRRATADLIFEAFADHQLIITTHDPLWFEWLKKAKSKRGTKMTVRRICAWSLDTGPSWGDHRADLEWLKSDDADRAQPRDRAIHAGRLLEEVMKNLCDNLRIAVTFNLRGTYTIAPLWQGFYAKARRRTSFKAKAGEAIDEIETLRDVRNWVGAHWNAWAAQLTDPEAKQFAESVLGLVGAVLCSSCGRFIQRIDALGGRWSCECEALRYER
jgi:hypothetical protein